MNNVGKIFRHFTGSYVLVKSLAFNPTDGQFYYTLGFVSDEGRDHIVEQSVFENSLVPEGITTQAKVYEIANLSATPLEKTSTDELLRTVFARPDNPLAELDIEGLNDLVFLREFAVGIVTKIGDNESFSPEVVVSSIEEAKKYLKKKEGRRKLFKVVYIDMGF